MKWEIVFIQVQDSGHGEDNRQLFKVSANGRMQAMIKALLELHDEEIATNSELYYDRVIVYRR